MKSQLINQLRGHQRRYWTHLVALNYALEEICRISENLLGYPEQGSALEL